MDWLDTQIKAWSVVIWDGQTDSSPLLKRSDLSPGKPHRNLTRAPFTVKLDLWNPPHLFIMEDPHFKSMVRVKPRIHSNSFNCVVYKTITSLTWPTRFMARISCIERENLQFIKLYVHSTILLIAFCHPYNNKRVCSCVHDWLGLINGARVFIYLYKQL